MFKKLLLILFLFVSFHLFAQRDSTPPATTSIDSTVILTDSLHKDSIAVADSSKQDTVKAVIPFVKPKPKTWAEDTLFTKLLYNPFLIKSRTPLYMLDEERKEQSKDELFYVLTGIMLFLAFIKVTFNKYFQNIFRLFFQSSLLQKQNRENLGQNNLPSLLLNLLFVFSGGLFITLIASHFHWINIPFWWLLGYATALLAVVYSAKYLFINFSGWVFNAKESAGMYSFIVFMVNKILGVLLLPLLLLIAFSPTALANVIVTVAVCLIVILLLYRYVLSLTLIRRSLSISSMHFFIYLCAVEIIPLLVIYKVLFNQISGNT